MNRLSNPPRIHFVVPLGAGRIDDQLTPASIARLDEGIKIAKRENAFGLVALGDYYSTWRQGKPYDTLGADLRGKYLQERIPKGMTVIKIRRGSDTLQELVSIRDVGTKYGIENVIIVTHPEHTNRVTELTGLIFPETYYPYMPGHNFKVEVESGDLPAGLINTAEERTYLDETVRYLKGKYPPDGIIPIMTYDELDPPRWIKRHAELYDNFRQIYEDFHKEGTAPEFYAVAPGKER